MVTTNEFLRSADEEVLRCRRAAEGHQWEYQGTFYAENSLFRHKIFDCLRCASSRVDTIKSTGEKSPSEYFYSEDYLNHTGVRFSSEELRAELLRREGKPKAFKTFNVEVGRRS